MSTSKNGIPDWIKKLPTTKAAGKKATKNKMKGEKDGRSSHSKNVDGWIPRQQKTIITCKNNLTATRSPTGLYRLQNLQSNYRKKTFKYQE